MDIDVEGTEEEERNCARGILPLARYRELLTDELTSP